MRIPPGLTKAHVLQAIGDLDAGVPNRFGVSRKYVLVYQGRHYSPKAVLGRAIHHLQGSEPSPKSFSGGDTTNNPLRELGFEVVTKS